MHIAGKVSAAAAGVKICTRPFREDIGWKRASSARTSPGPARNGLTTRRLSRLSLSGSGGSVTLQRMRLAGFCLSLPCWARLSLLSRLRLPPPPDVVSTDIGRPDPDIPVMDHPLGYAGRLNLEGIISSPFNPGPQGSPPAGHRLPRGRLSNRRVTRDRPQAESGAAPWRIPITVPFADGFAWSAGHPPGTGPGRHRLRWRRQP